MNEILSGRFAPVSASAATRAASSLDHLTLLAVRGPDARGFLDSQLTRNVPLAAAPASLAGYCSPKGRLLATFVVWADTETIWLLVSRDIGAAVAKRLRMYVLRAKLTIDDVAASHRLDGFLADGRLPGVLVDLPTWQSIHLDGSSWLRFPDVGAQPRYLRVAPHDGEAGQAVDGQRWCWFDVRAALPWITTATQDRFVPQMLNLEALGAVDFKKGCFPGQEVVARSQYLGKLKRRMALATSESSAPAGTDVWEADGREACGMVVNAETGPDGLNALLVELPVASFASSTLRIGASDGPALMVEPLPYALPDNEVFVRPKL